MRPYIICHMGTSIDGKLHPSQFTKPAAAQSQETIRGHYERIHDEFEADGWIVGRVTMAEMAKGQPRDVQASHKIPRSTHVANPAGRKLATGIDPSGNVHYAKDEVGGDHAVAVLGEQVTDAYLAELQDGGVSFVFAGTDGHDLAGALNCIAEAFGATKLLLEGGGGINGAFLKAGLIDEFSTLILPAVDGLAGEQSIVDYRSADGERPGSGQSLRLTSCETLADGVVWMRHKVERSDKK